MYGVHQPGILLVDGHMPWLWERERERKRAFICLVGGSLTDSSRRRRRGSLLEETDARITDGVQAFYCLLPRRHKAFSVVVLRAPCR